MNSESISISIGINELNIVSQHKGQQGSPFKVSAQYE